MNFTSGKGTVSLKKHFNVSTNTKSVPTFLSVCEMLFLEGDKIVFVILIINFLPASQNY